MLRFAWHQELARCSNGGAAMAALVCKIVDGGGEVSDTLQKVSLAHKSAPPVPPAATQDGEAQAPLTNDRVLFDEEGSVLYSAFMIVPFSKDTVDDEEGAGGKKGSKGKKEGKKSKKELEEEAKREEQAKKAEAEAAEALRKQQEQDRALESMAAPGTQIMDDPSIPKFTIVNLTTGAEEVLTRDNVELIFGKISLVYNRTLFPTPQRVADLWTQPKLAFNTKTPVYLYVPPVAAAVPELDLPVDAAEGEEASEKESPQEFMKILLCAEAHSLMREVMAKEVAAEVAEGEEAGEAAEREANCEEEGGEEETEENAARPSQPEDRISIVVHKTSWSPAEKVCVARVSSNRTACLELLVPKLTVGVVYSVHVNTAAGYYLDALASEAILMQSSKTGEIWEGPMNMFYKTDSNVYPAIRPDSWTAIFKYVLRVGPGGGPGAGKDKGKDKGKGKEKGKDKGAAAPVEVLPCNLPVPYKDDPATWVSFRVTWLDAAIAVGCAIELVDNDTFISTQLASLEGPFRLPNNENGYTLVASVLSQEPLASGRWHLSALSSKPLSGFSMEAVNVISEYEEVYQPKLHRGMLRNVLSASKPEQCAVEVRTNDPEAAIICDVYSVLDLLATPEDEPAPAPTLSLVGRPSIFIPALSLSKEQRYLVDVRLDPLLSGTKLDGDGRMKEGEEVPLKWKMRCIGASAVTVQADKTQEEEFNAIKAGWAKASAGRDKKAKASRDVWLEEARKAEELAQQANITLSLDGAKPISPEAMKAAREARDSAEVRGNALLAAMNTKRELQLQAGVDAAAEREKQRANKVQWFNTNLDERLLARSELRNKMLEQETGLMTLRNCMEQPVVMSAKAASKKTGKEKGGDGSMSLEEHMAGVEAAIAALTLVPDWKSGELVLSARKCVRRLAIENLKDAMCVAVAPVPVEDKKGKKKDDNAVVDPTEAVELWVKRSERFMVEFTVSQLQVALEPAEGEQVDCGRLQALLARLTEINAERTEEQEAVLEQAKTLVETQKDVEAAEEPTKAKTAKK